MIDFLLLVIFGIVGYCVASDGPWNAAITFVSVVLAGLLAMNFYEPAAIFLTANVRGDYDWQHYWDVIALMGIFAVAVFLFRLMGERLLPTYAEVNSLAYDVTRWGLGAATGYTTMAIVLTALHVAPLPREFIGFTPERMNFFAMSAPDRQWLGLTQYISERALSTRDRSGSLRSFDSVAFPANPANATAMETWSSFPIRYAHRREAYYSGQRPAAAGGASLPASGGPVQNVPQGGASTPGF